MESPTACLSGPYPQSRALCGPSPRGTKAPPPPPSSQRYKDASKSRSRIFVATTSAAARKNHDKERGGEYKHSDSPDPVHDTRDVFYRGRGSVERLFRPIVRADPRLEMEFNGEERHSRAIVSPRPSISLTLSDAMTGHEYRPRFELPIAALYRNSSVTCRQIIDSFSL